MRLLRQRSLRTKLLLASLLVQLPLLVLIVFNSLRISDEVLQERIDLRNRELTVLLNSALSAPLAERDYATVSEILTEIRLSEGVVYLVLTDSAGVRVAAAGWPKDQPVPAPRPHADLAEHRAGVLDLAMPIQLGMRNYGVLSYGLATQYVQRTRANLIQQSLLIGGLGIVFSVTLLTVLAYFLTRHLSRLTEASARAVAGDFTFRLPVSADDEVGVLTRSFNRMAEAVQARIDDLSASEARFHAIADYTYAWESWFDAQGRLIWINPSVARITGYTPEECLAMRDFPVCLAAPGDAHALQHALQTAQQGRGERFECRLRHRDGHLLWLAMYSQTIFSATQENLGVRTSMLDITQRREAETALQVALVDLKVADESRRQYLTGLEEERARLVALLGAMNLGILFVTADNQVKYYNSMFQRIWMIAEDKDLTGKSANEVLAYSSNELARPDHFSRHLLDVLETHEVSSTYEITMSDGRVVTQLSYPVRDSDNRFIGRLWVYEDVTRERQTAEQLIYLAERDALTGLYNRRRFEEELGRFLQESDRHQRQGALLFFDLDEFKYINDTFGHRAGDSVLIRVAGEVSALTRKNEIFSRLGGDEFGVLMPDANEADAERLAERIVRAVSQIPFRLEGQNFRLTTSLGIAHYPKNAGNSEELIAHADAAMYQAKETGKNAWSVYRPERDASREMITRLSWNDRIERAFEKDLLRLHFQGVYHAGSGQLSHLEVLIRMVDETDPTRLIMPGHFITYAEKSGKILDVDRWVLRQSIALLAGSPQMPPLAVNISGRSFDQPTLPHFIAEELRRQGVAPQRLLVELTETSAVSDLQDAERFIEALRKTGCITCLDDFGSGFSSFAYLKHLKADVLKIDGLFIRNLPHDRDNQVFVKSIVDVARGLGKRTVAEFVENEDTLAMLRHFGVDMVQGYHLDMPQEKHPALGSGLAA
ncbi:MAG: EAL domain-containing protein [Hylemonella sp.]|nr:EAL domain-containing protein [Hylemonella sp.]